jgi:hypothetical protein
MESRHRIKDFNLIPSLRRQSSAENRWQPRSAFVMPFSCAKRQNLMSFDAAWMKSYLADWSTADLGAQAAIMEPAAARSSKASSWRPVKLAGRFAIARLLRESRRTSLGTQIA